MIRVTLLGCYGDSIVSQNISGFFSHTYHDQVFQRADVPSNMTNSCRTLLFDEAQLLHVGTSRERYGLKSTQTAGDR